MARSSWLVVRSLWFIVHGLHSKNIKFLIKVAIFLFFITSYQLPVTSYECFAQDKIVAIVNNDVITQKDLDDFTNFMRMQLSGDLQGEKLEKKIESIKSGLLDRLIEDRLILQQAKKEGVKVDENRIKAKVDEIRRRYPSNIEFMQSLSKQGLTQADIERRIREQLSMYNIIDTKIRNRITVTPSEVTAFYQGNIEEFKTSTQREFETISIKDKMLADEIYGKLKGGEDFKALADKYSFYIDRLTVEAGQLNKDVEETVFKLKPLEASRSIRIKDTYYIFKLNRIIPPSQQSLAAVQDKVYAFLLDKKMQEKLTLWLDELKKQSYIKIF